MFGLFSRRRIAQLEAEVKALREALDFYAINTNWRRRSKHSRGSKPVRWEMAPTLKDHGGRAREALLRADAVRNNERTVTVPQSGYQPVRKTGFAKASTAPGRE